jgi:hypothetical protein
MIVTFTDGSENNNYTCYTSVNSYLNQHIYQHRQSLFVSAEKMKH